MAYNIDKNKLNNPGMAEITSTPSVSPAPTEAPQPSAVKINGQYYQPSENKTTQPTEQQEITAAEARARNAAANESANKEIAMTKAAALAQAKETEQTEEILSNAVETGDNAVIEEQIAKQAKETKNNFLNKEIEQSSKAKNYAAHLAEKDRTIYEKTSAILDEYITNHPEEYPQYAKMSAEKKKNLRDSEMGKIFRTLAGKENINQQERKTATRDLAILLITIESKGLSLKQLRQNPREMKSLIENGDKALFNNLIENIDTTNPDKALKDIAELYYTFTEPEYLLLEGNQKQQYLKTHSNKLLNIFGIKDIKAIPPEAKTNAANIMKGILTELSNNDMTIKDLTKMSASKQSEFLVKSLDKYEKEHPGAFDKLMPQTKKSFEILKAKTRLIQETGKEDPTEREIFELLQKKEQSGQLTEQEKMMLDSYKVMDAAGKNKGKDFLKATADLTSNTTKIMITGMSYEAQFKHQLDGVTDKKEIQKIVTDIANGTNNDFDKVIQLEALRKVLMEKGMKPEEIMKLLPEDLAQSITVGAISHPDKVQAAAATDIIASFDNPAMDEAANAANEALAEVRPPEWLKYYGANVQTTKYDQAFTTGINNNLNTETANQIFTFIANNATTDAKKTSIVEYSLTTTNDTERIKTYTESYKTIKNPAVTEGMAAAAHNTTNSENATIINSAVDYAIENNGYSTSEINNINTARQTGQTSYERSTESSATNSAQSKTEAKTSTQQKTQSQATATNPSTAQTNSNKTTVKLSTSNSNSVQQMRRTLAQLQYESSVAKKEKAMQDLQNIIDKIQNDQEVRAQKQAELKAKEAKTDEEIASAIKEAETKSADKQKSDEAKIAQEAKSSVQELNEVVETQNVENVAKKFNISVDDVKTLKEAHRQGDLNTIYTKLGSISAEAQKKFIQIISRKDTATIIGFIRNRSTDKALIKELCRLNPGLIKSLDADLLISCGLAKNDIIKYADRSQLSSMLASQARLGNTDLLNQFYEALGYSQEQISQEMSLIPGTSEWAEQMHNNMRKASTMAAPMGSTTVRSGNFPEGQTRKKIRPQDYPDYREYLA